MLSITHYPRFFDGEMLNGQKQPCSIVTRQIDRFDQRIIRNNFIIIQWDAP